MSNYDTSEQAMRSLFSKYASAGGNPDSMCKEELKVMLNKELPGLLKSAKEQQQVDALMSALDRNKDNEVDFNEFIVLVLALAKVSKPCP